MVFHGDLGLAVGPDKRGFSAFADFGKILDQDVGHLDGQWHELRGFIAGKAEHHPLVSGSLLFALRLGHPDGNIRGLALDRGDDGAGVTVKAERRIGIADVTHDFPRDLVIADSRLAGDLAGDHDHAGLRERFAGHPALRIFSQVSIEDGIGNLIAHLVRMTFRDGLRGEKVIVRSHFNLPPRRCAPECNSLSYTV